jgi:hypothetical protein
MPLGRPKKERGGTGIEWDIKILLKREEVTMVEKNVKGQAYQFTPFTKYYDECLKKRAGNALSMGEIRTVYTLLVRQHTTKILLEDLDMGKIIILKWI